jgi:DNA-binding SARP family transcriptional activator
VRVRVLGSCRVDGRDQPLARRDRVVLAALVAAAPAALPADRLAEALYGEEPPATWRKVIHGSVLRLRQVLGPRAIETVPDGYRLAVGDDEVDARLFERLYHQATALVAVGQDARAIPLLREALGLFQGPPLTELRRPVNGVPPLQPGLPEDSTARRSGQPARDAWSVTRSTHSSQYACG